MKKENYQNSFFSAHEKGGGKGINAAFFASLLSLFIVLSPTPGYAVDSESSVSASQNIKGKAITVTGKVIDAGGNPITGAVVFSKTSNQGIITGEDGSFELFVVAGTELEISFLGYISQTIVAEEGRITVILKEDKLALDAAVSVGYGTQMKKNLTGAVASVSGDDVISTKATNVTNSLAGKVAGVNIRQISGQPGQNNVQFNIRGFGTPAFVIDGVLRSDPDSFSRLNPEDIENISVLKDATASIYGIGAGNGVVIVTTKKGRQQRTKVSYSGLFGITAPTGIPEMCNAAEWVTLRNEAEVNAGRNPMWSKEEYDKWQTGAPGYESTDWQDAIMRKTSTQHQHMMSITGGNDKISFFVSYGYLNENGLFKNAKDISYDQHNLRSNLSFNIIKGLRADVNIAGHFDIRNSTAVDYGSIISQAHSVSPIYKIYANDNPEYLNDVYPSNPVAYASSERAGYSKYLNTTLQTTSTLTYDFPFVQGLTARVLFAYDYGGARSTLLNKGYNVYSYSAENDTYTAVPKNKPAYIQKNGSYGSLLNFQGSIGYKNTFKGHTIDALALWELFDRKGEWWGMSREYDVYTNDTIDQANSIESQKNNGSDNQTRNLSLVTKLHYDYAGKYLFDFASRYDGSWRYAPGQRWGFFPNISLGWRISEEPWIKDSAAGRVISNLKIRASAGQNGEDAGNPFQWIPGYTIGYGSGYIFEPGKNTQGSSSPVMVNDTMTWVKVNTYDIGFEAALWEGLLGIEFDWYMRDRTGLLAYRVTSTPWYFGQSLPQENLNSQRSMGLDLTLSSQKTFGDFRYGVKAIVNYARHMDMFIEQLPFTNSWQNWWSNNEYRLNGPKSTYKIIGRFQNMDEIYHAPNHDPSYGGTERMLPGDFIYEDLNGNGVIEDYDKRNYDYWNGTPLINYGINFDFAWKNFDLNILFNGALCYSLKYDGVYTTMLGRDGADNAPKYMLDRWHRADIYDPNSEWIPGEWPAVRKSSDVTSIYLDSSFWRKKGNYLRLKSVELGYTLPQELTKKVHIEKARIYLNGYNLFTVCDPFLKPFDPEKGDGGSTYAYPLSRLFNIGLNITF